MGDDDKAPGGKKKAKAKAPPLPKETPKDVKEFVACDKDTLTLDPTKKGWLPEIPLVGAPDVKIEAGAKAGTVKVTLSKTELVKFSIDVSVKDGHLDVDTSGVTIDKVKSGIDDWVKKLNDWLDAKKRKLKDITVKDGKATITKVAVGDGQTSVPADGGGGVRKAVAVGTGAVFLAGGLYLGANVLGGDDAGQGSGSDAAAVADDAGGAGAGTATFDCLASLHCEPDYRAIVIPVGVAITHDGSAPDAVTGDIGLSQGDVVGVTTWDDLIQVAADCAGTTSTAEATPDADGVFHLQLPLYQMVPCEITSFKLRDGATFSDGLPADVVVPAGSFDVGPSPTEVGNAQIDAALAASEALDFTGSDDARAVLDTLAPGRLCFLDVAGQDPAIRQAFASLCSGRSIAALLADLEGDRPTVGAITLTGFDPTAMTGLFGPDGTFRCGVGDIGITVCPPDPEVPTDPLLSVYQALLPESPAGGEVTFTLADLGSVTVQPDGADSTVTVDGDFTAWAVIRDRAVTVIVPGATADTYFVEGGVDILADFSAAVGDGGDIGDQPGAESETVEDFAAAFARAIATGDTAYAFDRLHPVVLQAFPSCSVDGLEDPTYAIDLIEVSEPGPYDYAPPSLDGRSFPVDDVVTVTADLTAEGQTSRQELHFGLVDGGYRYFLDCRRDQ